MSKGRVLAVDDQRYFRELIENLLTDEGYEVQTCASGEEALQALDHAVFDVIVTDLVMPVMTGIDLVQRVKERDPEQEIVVVTGVVDVQSAVDAMKIGATDYLLKPFDRAELTASLGGILQRARLRQERDRLLAENIEYLSERSLFERALALFGASSLEAVCERLLDGLCKETGAQSGVLWRAEDASAPRFRLALAHGLVRADEEQAELPEALLPAPLRGDAGATTCLAGAAADADPHGAALWVALRGASGPLAYARLGDKVDGEAFDDVDRAAAERFAQFGQTAYCNAERIRRLERRTLQDAETGAYRSEYLHGVVRNEIEKANRFGRRFALLRLAVGPLDALREQMGAPAFEHWHATLTRFVGRLLRSTDLLSQEAEGEFGILLAESDALGAAIFKQRLRRALEQAEPLAGLKPPLRPALHLGCASYPADATQLESLLRVVERRLGEDRRGRTREQQLAALPCADALATLLDGATPEPAPTIASLLRFAISEIGRRPRERGLLFCRPGEHFADAVVAGLRLRRGVRGDDTELVVLADPSSLGAAEDGVTWLPPDALPGCPPFALHCGEGPAYLLVADDAGGPGGARLFHSSERGLAETLAFRLQRELRLPRAEVA
jgi:diguanylate cyclase (GGDEF)-like protein